MTGFWIPQWLLVLVDIAAWGFFHAATGYAAHRLDDRRLQRDGWLLGARRFESGGRWYRHTLRIHRWKDRLPEAGAVGMSAAARMGTDCTGGWSCEQLALDQWLQRPKRSDWATKYSVVTGS